MFLTLWQRFLGNERLRRFTVLLFLVGVLYLVRSMMSLILLTFIFSFLVISLNDAIRKKIDIPSKLIVIIVYLLMIGGIYLAITILMVIKFFWSLKVSRIFWELSYFPF